MNVLTNYFEIRNSNDGKYIHPGHNEHQLSCKRSFQSHPATLDLGLEFLGLVPVWTISKVQGGQ